MSSRKRRLASAMGALGLTVCMAVAFTPGAVGAKKKKKAVKSVTVQKTTPTAIPVAPNPDQDSFTSVPLAVGKVAKGKVVGGNSISVTFHISTAAPGDLGHLGLRVTAPNGRSYFLDYPDDHQATSIGPLTITANSSRGYCVPNDPPPPPPPPCFNPEDDLGPPYIGTIGDSGLSHFAGIGAKGTWLFKVLNSETAQTFTLNSVKLFIPLAPKPR